MGTVDDYLAGLEDSDRAVIAKIYDTARATIPDTEQGTSYGMPALMWRGKPLIAVMRTKKHIALYPFSGLVPARASADLADWEVDKGTIRFQPEKPLTDAAVAAVVNARVAEIEDPSLRRRDRGDTKSF